MGCYSGNAGMKAGQGARIGNEIACYLSSRTQQLMMACSPGQREPTSADRLHGGIVEMVGRIRQEH